MQSTVVDGVRARPTYSVPEGWSVTEQPRVISLVPPEPGFTVAIVDVGTQPDAKAAVKAAWELRDPQMARAVRSSSVVPGRSGWDERAVFDYQTAPSESLVVQATALRQGSNWTVVVTTAPLSTLEKRAAGFALIMQSLRPAGYRPESFVEKVPNPLDAGRISVLSSFVRTAMRELEIPGASIALIQKGRIVFEGGFGLRALGRDEKVDEHTLFLIASNSKALSTLLLAKAVDEGKLSWDQRVTDVYPQFRLGDPQVTEKVLVRHLVCACTGLPRKDLEWAMTNRVDTPAASVFTKLANTMPTSKFGEIYQYNNLMAAAAGYIAGHSFYPRMELGAAYDKAMQTEIFQPLEMRDTTFDLNTVIAGDHALPHGFDVSGAPALATIDAEKTAIAYRPSGGAWSSAHDMIRYVGVELTRGVLPNGKRLVTETNLLIRRAPGVKMGEAGSYGMGLRNELIAGIDVVSHGGSMPGFFSDMIFIPQADVGAVILTNSEGGAALLQPFKRRLLEILYDGKPEAEADVASVASAAKAARAAPQPKTPPEPAALTSLASRYVSNELGQIEVSRTNGTVVFDFGLWRTQVGSVRNSDGSLSFVPVDPAMPRLPFTVAERGGQRALIVREAQHEYVYLERRTTGQGH